MQKILILIVFGFLSINVLGQSGDFDVMLNDPTRLKPVNKPVEGGFRNFAENPGSSVDLFTGVLSYSVPVFNIELTNFSMPINLSYSSNSMNISQLPSDVGYGWVLSGLPKLQRTIKGATADLNHYKTPLGISKYSSKGVYYRDEFPTSPGQGWGSYDNQFDEFNLSLINDKTKFILKGKGPSSFYPLIQTSIKLDDITVSELEDFSKDDKYIYEEYTSFEFISKDGIKYTFNNYAKTFSAKNYISGTPSSYYHRPSEWLIKEIRDLITGEAIHFNYKDIGTTSYYPIRSWVTEDGDNNYKGLHYGAFGLRRSEGESFSVTRLKNTKVLESITWGKGEIEFIHNNKRQDIYDDSKWGVVNDQQKSLDEIVIKDNRGNEVSTLVLEHDYHSIADYFNESTLENENGRLQLTKVYNKKTINGKEVSLPGFEFSYYGERSVNKKLGEVSPYCIHSDAWGNFNGMGNKTDHGKIAIYKTGKGGVAYNAKEIPYAFTAFDASYPSVNLGINKVATYPDGIITPLLREVNLPTGGKLKFDYSIGKAKVIGTEREFDVRPVISEIFSYYKEDKAPLRKTYEYSGGICPYPPEYFHPKNELGLEGMYYTVNQTNPLINADFDIGFTNVTEYIYDKDDLPAHNDYTFHNVEYDWGTTHWRPINGKQTFYSTENLILPALKPIVGKMHSKEMYKYDNNNNKQKVGFISWQHYFKEIDQFSCDAKIYETKSNDLGPFSYPRGYYSTVYKQHALEYVRESNVLDGVESIANYDFDLDCGVVNKTHIQNSDGSSEDVEYQFAKDYLNNTIYNELHNDYNYLTPLGSVKYYSENSDNYYAVQGSFVTFNQELKPYLQHSLNYSNIHEGGITSSDLELNLEGSTTSLNNKFYSEDTYIFYDYFQNPCTYISRGQKTMALVWGYDNNYPVAEIENATFGDIQGVMQDRDIEDIERSFDDATIRQKVGVLRDLLPQARITIYTYKPLVGLTSVTDPNAITTFYEYDDLNRLEYIRDHDGNILKKYEYKYANQ